LQQIAIAACRYATIAHYLYAVIAVAAAPFIIFSLPPAVLRLALIPPPVPLSPTAVAAATAVHYHCCRCREYNPPQSPPPLLFEYNRYRCYSKRNRRRH